MHVGEPVAMVVAKSAAAAQDAADLVVVDYTPLKPVTDLRAAMAPGAPQLWPEAPGNIGFDWTAPADPDGKKQAALDRAFKEAAHVARVELVNQRLVVAALEPRTATASFDAGSNRYTLRCGTQGVGGMRMHMAESMGIKPEELLVLTDDVGGGFGMKAAYLSGICRAAARRPHAWQTDPLGLDALGSLRDRQSGPRFTLDGGTRAQQARAFPRLAGAGARQYRRLFYRHRTFHCNHAHLRLPADSLRYSARAGEFTLRVHQYGADGPLSRRRPSGGKLPARARYRCCGRSDWHRRRGAAAAEFDRARQNPVHHGLRKYLRQRRLPGGVRARTERWPIM